MFIILTLLMPGCEDYEGLPYQLYTIKEGRHSSAHSVELLNRSFLVFDVIFDESAKYFTNNPANQADVNKLFGFADCNEMHQNNSLRFGWRWNPNPDPKLLKEKGGVVDPNGMVEILAYCYVDSKRIIEPLTYVEEASQADGSCDQEFRTSPEGQSPGAQVK